MNAVTAVAPQGTRVTAMLPIGALTPLLSNHSRVPTVSACAEGAGISGEPADHREPGAQDPARERR